MKGVITENSIYNPLNHWRDTTFIGHIKQIFDRKIVRVASYDSPFLIKITSSVICSKENASIGLQKAINKCPEGGTVSMQKGNFNMAETYGGK